MNKKRFTFFRINWKEPVEVAKKRSVGDLKEADLKGAKVFVRVDLNVPLDDNFNITDDTKSRAAVPTIKYLMTYGAKVILSSHLGRPKGVTPKYSLKPLVPRLSEFLGVEVKMANDCIGKEVVKMVAALQEGSVLLLENVMFYKEEEKNDPAFAKKLALLADLYVNDAFGTAHRAHASTEGVAKYLKPAVAGFVMQKIVPASCIPDGWMGLDRGPNSIKAFGEALDTTKTIIWYGYMGMFEFDEFPAGTEAIAKKLADLSGEGVTTIIGGGDSVAVVEKVGLAQKMSHISIGGDASFELMEGKQLPGVQALTNIADGGN